MEKAIYHAGYRRLVGKLRDARTRCGLLQSDVAAKLGVARTWVSKVETCELRLDVLGLVRLCRVYGVSVQRLVRELEGELSDDDSPFLLALGDVQVPGGSHHAAWDRGSVDFYKKSGHGRPRPAAGNARQQWIDLNYPAPSGAA